MKVRPGLEELGLSSGKKARLHRILRKHGLGNGTAIFLPFDQGIEQGPGTSSPTGREGSGNTCSGCRGGRLLGIAFQIGLAEKFYWEYAGEVPLVLKLNGKTDIPGSTRRLR